MGVTSIHSTTETSDISMNDNGNVIHTYYASFLSSNHPVDVSSEL